MNMNTNGKIVQRVIGFDAHPDSFTAAVSEMLALPVQRERIGAAGRRLYEEQYTWETVWKALDMVLGLVNE